jgi:hypothetical protein
MITCRTIATALAILSFELAPTGAQEKVVYLDGRPSANLRYEARDVGVVLPFGKCPDSCDMYGARDVWVFMHRQKYYMHYDAAGPTGWLTALATSRDRDGRIRRRGKRQLWHHILRR